jgi:hypothetical protein
MADEDQTNHEKPEEPAAGAPTPEPPPPPPIYQIPEQLLLKWIGVPEDAIITSPLRRRDVDNLILGMLRLADAQAALDATLVLWSNGKQQEANQTLADFRHRNADAQNRLRLFLAAVMASFPGLA